MLFFLAEWLTKVTNLPPAFTYTSTRMVLAAATGLLLTILLGPAFIKKLYELKIGQPIRKEECPPLGELHKNKQNTPTMGGILILSSILISALLWMDLTSIFTLQLILATVILGALGAYDDYRKLKYKNAKGLPGRYKLLCQFLFSFCIAAYFLFPSVASFLHVGDWFAPPVIKTALNNKDVVTVPLTDYMTQYQIPFFKHPLVLTGFWGTVIVFAMTLFVITGASNAVNLTDGLDGLATGCLLLAAAPMALMAFLSNHVTIADYLNILYVEGSGEIAIYLCAFFGACLGFLWFNGHPAQVFMGDTGSLALGGILGTAAVLLKREFFFALVGGIFVIEALSVILQVLSYRLRDKKRIFLCAPLHHHFEYKGLPETKVVVRFWIVALLFVLIGVGSIKFQ